MNKFHSYIITSLLFAFSFSASANDLEVNVTTADENSPLFEAVVTARPVSPEESGAVTTTKHVLVDQVDKEFVNRTSLIKVGDSVNFPNNDNIRHHVYSFSPAKSFELPLYKEMPAEPIVFDKSGVVKIGCNIHDWMIGYIYVSDSPFNGMTNKEGNVVLTGLPEGEYDVQVWHAQMKDTEQSTTRRVAVKDSGKHAQLSWEIAIKPDFRPRRARMKTGRGY